MPRRLVSLLLLASAVVVLSGPVGCHRPQKPAPDSDLLEVDVAKPLVQPVVEFHDLTGRLDAVNAVDVRPRVTGYIVETPFKEGDLVKENETLFKIDPRPYQAKLDDSVSYLELQKAKLKLARADNLRAKKVGETPGAISKQELDKYQAGEEEARAAVNSAQASTEVHKLNLLWCRVESPISGRVSRYYLTKGNLVNQDSTLLTSVVSEDPIYAYADADERALLRVRRGIESGRIKMSKGSEIPVYLALADEKDFPHKGFLNFTNNKLDPLTGTITLRFSFANPLIKSGRRLMEPGMFVRIRIPLGEPQRGVLVAERCLVTDQGLKNVFILDGDDKVQYRRVELGPLQPNGLRVIDSGLDGSERVLLSGLQIVRPGMKVQPNLLVMPIAVPDAKVGIPAPPKTDGKPAGKGN